MSSFISNFKKYQNSWRFLCVLCCGILVMCLVNFSIYCIRQNKKISYPEEQLFNSFFGRKCLPMKWPVIFYGDSRTYYGIDPAVVSEITGKDGLNAGFGAGGMNEMMMRYIDSRILRGEAPSVIVLGVSPYSLTETARQNECFLHYSKKLQQHGERLFQEAGASKAEIALMPLYKVCSIGSLRNGKIVYGKRYTHRYHDNGHCETLVHGDTSKSVAWTMKIYKERHFAADNPISRRSEEETLSWIRRWSREGILVFAFRPPTCEAMVQLENTRTAFPERHFPQKVREAGGFWLEYPHADLNAFDASHLDGASAVKLSRFLGEQIASEIRKRER